MKKLFALFLTRFFLLYNAGAWFGLAAVNLAGKWPLFLGAGLLDTALGVFVFVLEKRAESAWRITR